MCHCMREEQKSTTFTAIETSKPKPRMTKEKRERRMYKEPEPRVHLIHPSQPASIQSEIQENTFPYHRLWKPSPLQYKRTPKDPRPIFGRKNVNIRQHGISVMFVSYPIPDEQRTPRLVA